MLAYLDANNNPVPWSGEPVDGVYYQLNVETLWTADQLTAVGLYPVHLFVVPPGQVIVGPATYTLSGVVRMPGTTVIQTFATEPAPPPFLPIDAEDDAAAAAAGVLIGQFYRDGSKLMIRVS